jgi:hypothetical protein
MNHTISLEGVEAPYAQRTVRLGSKTIVNLAEAGHPLAGITPETPLGALALDLAMAASTTYLTVVATTAYVNAITELSLPELTFGPPPAGVPVNPQDLQAQWSQFVTQVNVIKGELATFVNSTPGSADPTTILSQLVSLPNKIDELSDSVNTDFITQDKAGIDTLFQALSQQTSSLSQAISTLGTNIDTGTQLLVSAADSGVLEQLYNAYEKDIKALKAAIESAQDSIDSDNKKLAGEYAGATISLAVATYGLANWFTPQGFLCLLGGVIGGYFAIEEINYLKGEIATLKSTISSDTIFENEYAASATAVQGTIGSIAGFSSMRSSAEAELLALENVLNTMAQEFNAAMADIDTTSPDWTAAQNEWKTILSTAVDMMNIMAYIWPNPILLSNPTGLISDSSGLYQIASSGKAYYLSQRRNAWTSLPGKLLSVVTGPLEGDLVLGIDGAPAQGAAGVDPAYPTDFFVKMLMSDGNSWQTISDFAVAQVATDGSQIFAIKQLTSDRQVYSYTGSETNWTALPALPNADAPSSIAVAGGSLFALSTNSQQVYCLEGSSWTLIDASRKYMSISANGDFLGLVDTGNLSYLWNASGTGNKTLIYTGSSIASLAQMSNGDQLIVNTGQLLYFIDNSVSPAVSKQLAANVVGITANGLVYRADADGNGYQWTNPATNEWTQIAPFNY